MAKTSVIWLHLGEFDLWPRFLPGPDSEEEQTGEQ